ncbi:SDR family NAD(P)-dependent oxidoreductase [Enhygromyxa salina]|uniref:Diacetyl reductase n=1 Tax=Enhygromyxa salina TaxID=215803 RepID=A0A2S9YAF4_9BACT|nr:SDR family oxidoreductase [Enhygromyxa salina]PRQ02083.1 Diacetyl reductase [Enhygromyxa salina]
MSKLRGKTAVITGGATGIGLATAKRFIADGAFVYIMGRRQDALDAALSELGVDARAVQGDVTKAEDLDRLFETVRAERGRVDVLFANAGIGIPAPLGQITPEQFSQTFDVNVRGTLFTVQKALPLMQDGGSIILTGSTTGVMGTPGLSIYSATKAAIRNFARSWAHDLVGTGIRVNVLSPGPTKTPGLDSLADTDEMRQAIFDSLIAATPVGRMADPAETAAAAAFLASEDSSFMTGSEVFVDGGYAQV